MELEAIDGNEIKDEKEKLNITQFELNDQKKKLRNYSIMFLPHSFQNIINWVIVKIKAKEFII